MGQIRCRQKAEFLRVASLSKSSNRVNNNSIFNIKYAEFSANGRCFFIFPALLVNTTTLTISTKNSFLYFIQFSPQFYILTIPTNTLFLYTSAIFYLPILAYKHPNNLHQKLFPCLSHLTNSGCVKVPAS